MEKRSPVFRFGTKKSFFFAGFTGASAAAAAIATNLCVTLASDLLRSQHIHLLFLLNAILALSLLPLLFLFVVVIV